MTQIPDEATAGQAAYEAYREHAQGKIPGVDLPPWGGLPDAIKEAWDAAGMAAWKWKEGIL